MIFMKKLIGLLFAVLTICTVLSAMSFSVYAIQRPDVRMLTFTVSGTETYSDGSALTEDECYALVWSKDGEFDGFNPDGTPTGTGDEVLYIGKIYKDSTVSFQLPDGFKSGGVFEIFILDSRVFDNGELQSVGKNEGIVKVRDYVKLGKDRLTVSGRQAVPTPDEGLPNGVVIASPTVDPTNIPALRFTLIKLDGDYVVMEAENVVPGVNYAIVASEKESGAITATGNKIVFIRPKEGDRAIIRGLEKTVFSTGDLRLIITIAAVFTVSVLVLAFKRKKRCPSSYCGEQKK